MEEIKLQKFRRNIVLPDPNIGIKSFIECCNFIEYNIELLGDFPPQIQNFNVIDVEFPRIYYMWLANALRILNVMDGADGNDMIGMEMSNNDNSSVIFHDEIDLHWVSAEYSKIHRFIMLKLILILSIPFK